MNVLLVGLVIAAAGLIAGFVVHDIEQREIQKLRKTDNRLKRG